MENYTIERNPEMPVLIAKLTEIFSMQHDVKPYIEALEKALSESTEPVFFITDATDLSVSFTDLVMGMATVTIGVREARAVVQHPNIREMIVISANKLVTLGTKAMKQSQYGGISVTAFDTEEQALAYIRQTLAQKASPG